MHTIALILLLLLLAASVSAHATQFQLTTGTLCIPQNYQPRDGKVDLVVHFHGSPDRVRGCLAKAERSAAMVTVAFSGLSYVYQKPFSDDRKLFQKILREAKRKLTEHCGLKTVSIDRLVVSSFSAGFGAVREILKDPSCTNAITDLVLVDTLYAGYIRVEGKDAIDPDDMKPFEGIVQRAVQGKANVWITYSEVVPPGYASTFETADFLVRKFGGRIFPASGVDGPGLNLIAAADIGGFHVRGYSGNDGPAHMKHLYGLDVFYRRTSLPDSAE